MNKDKIINIVAIVIIILCLIGGVWLLWFLTHAMNEFIFFLVGIVMGG